MNSTERTIENLTALTIEDAAAFAREVAARVDRNPPTAPAPLAVAAATAELAADLGVEVIVEHAAGPGHTRTTRASVTASTAHRLHLSTVGEGYRSSLSIPWASVVAITVRP